MTAGPREGLPAWEGDPVAADVVVLTTADPAALARESVRKLIHLGMVVLPVWLWWAPQGLGSHGLFLALIVVLGADVSRRVWNPWAHWIEAWSRPYRRPQERQVWVGVHAMFLAAWLLSWSVPVHVAVLSLCYGVFGDTAAALVGMRWSGKPGKSHLGSVACFVVCCAVGLVLWPHNAVAVLLGAGTATVCERLSGPVDDNLSIPLGTAMVLSLLT